MRKMKKKTKKKIRKGILCTLTGFLLITLSYKETLIIEKEERKIANIEDGEIFNYVDNEELMDILDKGTGVVLVVNKKTLVNTYLDLLYDLKGDNKLYVYNIKNEERVLSLNENNEIIVTKEGTEFYDKLLTKLGSHVEDYYVHINDEKTIKSEYKTLYTPSVLFISDGKILYCHYLMDNYSLEEKDIIDAYSLGYDILES